tara:strand:+ start:323 stop:469 length:147 start_codon:yes stop_codon:yes gene_type:complete
MPQGIGTYGSQKGRPPKKETPMDKQMANAKPTSTKNPMNPMSTPPQAA